jgi:hypothetical protein
VKELELQGVNRTATAFFTPLSKSPDNIRVVTGLSTVVSDLSRDSARQLRDWLDEWLGDTRGSTYTDEDVKRLVAMCEQARPAITTSRDFYIKDVVGPLLVESLAPFQPPDPDAELIEEMAKTYTGGQLKNMSYDYPDVVRGNMRKVLSAIREHDARKSGTTSPSH